MKELLILVGCVLSLNFFGQQAQQCFTIADVGEFIPDDQENCLTVSINVENEDAEATVETTQDIPSVWVVMEHSSLTDLTFTLTCPNGQSVVLGQGGDLNVYLGDPFDDDLLPEENGVCSQYSWSHEDGLLTMSLASLSAQVLPEGAYASFQTLENLLGCPVNGDWTLEICDTWASDNGYLCSWGISFDNDFGNLNCANTFFAGCTDPSACNYFGSAVTDDGGCVYDCDCPSPIYTIDPNEQIMIQLDEFCMPQSSTCMGGTFNLYLYDVNENAGSGSYVLVYVNGDSYEIQMNDPSFNYFSFPVSCGDVISVIAILAEGVEPQEFYVEAYNCSGELVLNSQEEVDLEWSGLSDCEIVETPIEGEWDVCAGQGGQFADSSVFETCFIPETTGLYTLCFTDECDNESIIELFYLSDGECQISSGLNEFIPDDQSECFTSVLSVTSEIPDAQITSAEDIEAFWVSIEHSFMGDLLISYVCPNGQSMTVHQQGGGGTYLGEPHDEDFEPEVQGLCYSYAWSQNAVLGTFEDEGGGTLESGVYSTVESWENLIGCPVTGDWTLEVCDLWASDNGYLCGWGISFTSEAMGADCAPMGQLGCTDNSACNYSNTAQTNDYTCVYSGCLNYITQSQETNTHCDSTYYEVNFSALNPSSSVFYISAGDQTFPVETGIDYGIWFTETGLHNVILIRTDEDGVSNPLQEIIATVEVIDANFQPQIVQTNSTLSCANCDADDDLMWYIDNELIGTQDEVDIVGTGTATLCVSQSDDCEQCSELFTYTAIAELNAPSITIYGNGSNAPWFISNSTLPIELTDVNGKSVQSASYAANQQYRLDDLSAGIYFLRQGEQVYRVSVVK